MTTANTSDTTMSAAVRAVRRSAGFSLETIAAATGTNTADLAATLAHIPARGRCSNIAATTAATHTQPEVRTFALTHRTFPPPQTRTVHTTNHNTANTRQPQETHPPRPQNPHHRPPAPQQPRNSHMGIPRHRRTFDNPPHRRQVRHQHAAATMGHPRRRVDHPPKLADPSTRSDADEPRITPRGQNPNRRSERRYHTPTTANPRNRSQRPSVRTAAAANPNCAQRTLQTLATDPDPSTRAALLNNVNLPKAIARSLLNDPSAAVRSRAETHPVNEFIALEWAAKKLHSTTRRLRRNQRR